jgi:hypothetical protein
MRRILMTVIAATLASVSVTAQTQSAWTVLSGIEQFALRDIVRSGPPVDASPITWEGSGPVLVVERARVSPTRRHAVNVSIAGAGGFEYQSPLGSFAAPSGDAARRVEGRYEYDRRMLTRHLPAFVEATIGIRGAGEYLSLSHSVDPSWDIGLSSRSGSAAFVLAASFGRNHRLWGDVRYGNGIVIGWVQPHSDTSGASSGGWMTDLDGGINQRISATLFVTARIVTRGDTYLSSHRGFSTSNPRFVLGVRYAN